MANQPGLIRWEQLHREPTLLPQAVQSKLAAYHGQNAWQAVIRNWAGAWLELANREGDLYQGRLNQITCPVLVILGGRDEHTPVGEMERVVECIANARLLIYPDAGHSVHDGHSSQERCTREVRLFFNGMFFA